MIATIQRMGDARDSDALLAVWELLGGSSPLPDNREDAETLVIGLVRDLCGRGEMFTAERQAVSRLAKTLDIDPEMHPRIEGLEDAVVQALAQRLQERLGAMNDDERRTFVEKMVARMPDEDRLRLIEQVLQGYSEMPPDAQAEFRRRLAKEFDLDEEDLAKALLGGAAALIPLLVAKQAGFAVFLWTTELMFAASSAIGVAIPFGAYVLKNQALGWLLGPLGMLVTGVIGVGAAGSALWRQKRQFRQMVPVLAYCSNWRDRHAEDS